ncbi:hypothetical protein L3V86_03280 [Thiotrichales bacterium 19S11-10]|nr:hypothetical protein [Thiotrichales bacterium 19S11-10]
MAGENQKALEAIENVDQWYRTALEYNFLQNDYATRQWNDFWKEESAKDSSIPKGNIPMMCLAGFECDHDVMEYKDCLDQGLSKLKKELGGKESITDVFIEQYINRNQDDPANLKISQLYAIDSNFRKIHWHIHSDQTSANTLMTFCNTVLMKGLADHIGLRKPTADEVDKAAVTMLRAAIKEKAGYENVIVPDFDGYTASDMLKISSKVREFHDLDSNLITPASVQAIITVAKVDINLLEQITKEDVEQINANVNQFGSSPFVEVENIFTNKKGNIVIGAQLRRVAEETKEFEKLINRVKQSLIDCNVPESVITNLNYQDYKQLAQVFKLGDSEQLIHELKDILISSGRSEEFISVSNMTNKNVLSQEKSEYVQKSSEVFISLLNQGVKIDHIKALSVENSQALVNNEVNKSSDNTHLIYILSDLLISEGQYDLAKDMMNKASIKASEQFDINSAKSFLKERLNYHKFTASESEVVLKSLSDQQVLNIYQDHVESNISNWKENLIEKLRSKTGMTTNDQSRGRRRLAQINQKSITDENGASSNIVPILLKLENFADLASNPPQHFLSQPKDQQGLRIENK